MILAIVLAFHFIYLFLFFPFMGSGIEYNSRIIKYQNKARQLERFFYFTHRHKFDTLDLTLGLLL